MSQIFMIMNNLSTELCYLHNKVIDKFVETLETNIWDSVACKRYISTSQVEEFKTILDQLSIKWTIATVATKHSEADVEKYLKDKKVFSTSNNKYLNDFYDLRRNFIRIKRLEEMIQVELPMSVYSFHVLSKLRKAYSIDSYAWNFVGEKNIAKLFATCSENKIGIIEEVKNVDRFLTNFTTLQLDYPN